VPLDLQPYEAVVLVALSAHDQDVPAAPANGPADAVELTGPWTVAYADAPEQRADVAVPHRWEGDPGRADYSGGATYETTVTVDGDRVRGSALLDLGPVSADARDVPGEPALRGASYRAEVAAPVGEVAQVIVNGVDCGWAWAPPYAVDVTGTLRAGENTVVVRVFGTGLGALRTNTELATTVDAVTSIDGKRFTMQDLELAQRPTTSGLRAVPSLRFRQR
jgi:hypothetical protein